MVYIFYLLVSAGVVWLSIKASEYIDLIDKKTKLSGAFLGGVLLSAVTSLPELFTSISATVLLRKPGLCIGNILGSNLFNMLILAVMFVVCIRNSARAPLSKGHRYVLIYLAVTYLTMALNMVYPHIFDFNLLSVSLTSLVIVVCYLLGVRHLAGEGGAEENRNEDLSPLTVRAIVWRFIAASVGIVGLSILMTYLTDEISVRLNIGAGLAGAIFLGVATSLPELSSTVALFRIRNYDIAVGNIVGSCLFNMIILSVADILWRGGTVYDFSDPKVVNLLLYGGVAMGLTYIAVSTRSRWGKVITGLGIIACYAAFLLV